MGLLDFDAKPDAYAVMGNPIAHSKSPRIHALFAKQTRQRLTYTAILVEPGGFAQAVGNFHANGGKGLNVTVPFKQEAWRLVDERSPRAERAGAVNTITLHKDGSRSGENTDGVGLVSDLSRLGVTLRGRRVLILGAGGAVRGVLEPLLDEGPAELLIANRTVTRAEELASAFAGAGAITGCGFDELEGRQSDVIINGTTASLQGEVPPLPDAILAEGATCYDMMYAAEPTAFVQWARERHAAAAHDGLGMLVAQAAESFYIWRGVRPEIGPVIETLRRELSG
ncbi:shikimate dehydrogenase [Thiohalomonas denitrificans]|uniref:shikimate dehydrogenase n=1 Tax=Thiohalomonas denitrificans TaxID=415747 RepID=UPI0026EB9FD9|nr:shikimate dehydrogenase [Thiohalomonas denitrificans]